MKTRKIFIISVIFAMLTSFTFAEEITLNWTKDGTNSQSITLKTSDGIPADLIRLVSENKSDIEKALTETNVAQDDVNTAVGKVKDAYSSLGDKTPIGTAMDGLDNFSADLGAALANAQLMQDIWPQAWIGKFIPGFHIGGGINVAASEMKITALKNTAKALDIGDVSELPDSLAFPAVAADLRIGGILFPFDVGLSFMKVNSKSYSAIDEAISPIAFNYYTFGIDARWAIIQGGEKEGIAPRVSVGGGFAVTKGDVMADSDEASASLAFSTKSFYADAQVSTKLLFLVPFAGVKLSVSNTNVEWAVNAKWDKILDSNAATEFGNLNTWGILPSKIDGGYKGTKFIPQIYGGLGIDLFILNVNVAAGYDFVDKLGSAAVNVRIAW